MILPACPICKCENAESKDSGLSAFWSCPRCGVFLVDSDLSDMLEGTLRTEEQQSLLSHYIRKMQNPSRVVSLNQELLQNVLRNKPPSTKEQINNFVLWLGKELKRPGGFVLVSGLHQSVAGSTTGGEYRFVLSYLVDERLMQSHSTHPSVGEDFPASLTFRGWEYFDQLQLGTRSTRKAFMAMKFGNPVVDKVVDEVYRPALKQTGFDLFRVSERPKAGLIDDNIRVEIRTSRFLISDLTDENAGAYWEAGFAEGLGKPVIYSCERKKFEEHQTHFDTNHHLTVLWDSENPEEAGKALKATIRATLPDEAKLED